MPADAAPFERTLTQTRAHLLAERIPDGHWIGELSTSALSTATAVTALSLVDARAHEALIRNGLAWLAAHANADGGWGDTVRSKSNFNTTSLCWAALACLPPDGPRHEAAVRGCEDWLRTRAGSLEPRLFAQKVLDFYGADRTFSTPILTLLALTGRLGPREQAFALIPALPFELAAAPYEWYKWLHLPVVSYAIPALVAIGQVRHRYRPPFCPLKRLVRRLTRERTLRVVERMQPENGGFLEAIPLTSFVTACLAALDRREHIIVRRAVSFLQAQARPDGGWPIDSNLATFVTTLAVNAFHAGGELAALLDDTCRRGIVRWLLAQQHRDVHPFTNAAPGGWAWSELAGAVPDSDDTPGALLALYHLAPDDPEVRSAAAAGVRWLLDLQNRDSGVPSFCRGWGKLPFDRSAPDLTAHTLAAWHSWRNGVPAELQERLARALPRALTWLRRVQRANGAWVPLWFGNEWMHDDENPLYGTARVLTALAELPEAEPDMLTRGVAWILEAQGPDGGWGGGPGGPPSVEETALAVDALASLLPAPDRLDARVGLPGARIEESLRCGVAWLIEQTHEGRDFSPAPIGFYFAKLWYFERLYPVVFALGALEKARGFHTLPR